MAQIRAAGGALAENGLHDPLLTDIAAQLEDVGRGAEARANADDRYLLGFARLAGPDRHFVTVYLVQAVRDAAVANARGIVLVGAFVALFGVALLVAILRSQVGRPLRVLIGATEGMEAGQFDVRVPVSGTSWPAWRRASTAWWRASTCATASSRKWRGTTP